MIDIILFALRISIRALRVNKMRSALTMLGIIIGVSAVITMLAVGTGASNKIEQQISSMGSNLLIVMSGSTTQGGIRGGAGTQPTLSLADADAIIKECPAVADAAPTVRGTAQIAYSTQNWSTMIMGATASVFNVRDWTIISGRTFTDQDVKSAAKTAIIGQTVVENLFGEIDPVGKFIRIKGLPFQVIGILSEKGQTGMGQDQDDIVYVPVTTAQKKLFGSQFPGMVRDIMVKANSLQDLPTSESQISALLRQRHHIGSRQENDFTVRNLTQMMEAAEQSAKVMTMLLGAIASVSLIVGGIGIMNIMLVSVTERTREIGIRMAVGAETWDIRMQFLMEAVTLSLLGGIIGIITGLLASWLLSMIAGWPTVVSPLSVIMSFGFSGLVGVFFGYYPAYKASLLNPIDALRFE